MKSSNKDITALIDLFSNYYGVAPSEVVALPGSGSNRKYYRLTSSDTTAVDSNISCIGVVGDDLKDCRAFVKLDKLFFDAGINVPEIYGYSPDYKYYIQQDLGETQLMTIINECKRMSRRKDIPDERYEVSDELVICIRKSLRELARLQMLEPSLWENETEYPPFNARQIKWDLNYFKYEFVKPAGAVFDEDALENDFELLSSDLLNRSGKWGFMYRDCQSRNVMIYDDKPYFIDFQGGRMGPMIYDVISFLWQAKGNFQPSLKKEMLEEYISYFPDGTFGAAPQDRGDIVNRFVLFRTLQVLGAYGFRGLVERKAHFIESIPSALSNLEDVIATGIADSYPELKRVALLLCENSKFRLPVTKELKVKIFSFSYKKGYPEDLTGNGGGFMFDCRGMHNPGRYEEYKQLTGRDRSVIEFLEDRGEVQAFVDNAVKMVAPAVEAYLRRRFNNLQVGFGCTGGQHRSVYCADKLARILAEKYPDARIQIIHREQGIFESL